MRLIIGKAQWLNVIIITGVLSLSNICGAQPPVSPPHKAWVSLNYSTLDVRPPDWKWLRTQCVESHVLKVLQPISNKLGALVVPVFDDGRCFYTTDITPFKGRNPNAVADEQALRSLIDTAHKSGTPVYLGLDVLGWQKTQPENKTAGVFGKLPQLQEISKDAAQSARPEALYASPFNKEVRSIMTALVKEIATKFPEASGLVLDVRLSGGEILGYSEAARAASILEKSLDPIDLNISNAANAIIDAPVREWIEWRRGVILNFVRTMTVMGTIKLR